MKLTPFGDALSLANGGCGGSRNGDPGVTVPTQSFAPGQTVTVSWSLTIPHPDDNLDSGVRIAVHYGAGDTFDANVLLGGVVGSGQPGTLSAEQLSAAVTLPTGKTCDYCTIQWIWAANQDGGSYIGCADIAITAGGVLPNYAALPSQTGNVLPFVKAAASGPSSIVSSAPPPPSAGGDTLPAPDNQQQAEPSGSDTTAIVVVVVLVVIALVGAGAFVWHRRQRSPAPTLTKTAQQYAVNQPPPPPPPPPRAPALPPGWSTAVDPASGQTYYLNASTAESQWTPPQGI